MTKNIAFAVLGIVLGFTVGFLLTNSLMPTTSNLIADATLINNQNSSVAAPPLDPSQVGQALPPNHPSLAGSSSIIAAGASSGNAQNPGTSPNPAASSVAATDLSAQQSAMQIADAAPRDFNKQMEAAIVFYQAKDYAKATFYLQRAIKINPRDADALVALGDTQYDAGNLERAAEAYERALAINPRNPDARTDLGNTYFLRQDYARAIAEYNRSLAVDARHEKTLQNLALAQIKAGDINAAKEVINRLAAVNPQNPNIASLRAQAGE